jgi:branched-chain amino acid transport system substrate-binding protein
MLSKIFPRRQVNYFLYAAFTFILLVAVHFFWGSVGNLAPSANAQTSTLKIAVAVSLTGSGESYGSPTLEGVQLAVEEANAANKESKIELATYDDQSNPDQARKVAAEIAASDALVVVGPATTPMALAAGPIYAEAGIASIGTTATGDEVTQNATTFQASFRTSDGGEEIANYLYYALGGKRAAVLFKDDSYGQPFVQGFKRAADQLKITTDYYPFSTPEQAQESAKRAMADPDKPAIVLGMVVTDAVPVLTTIRQQGLQVPILGTNAIAGEFLTNFFKDQPQERQKPGYFTNGVYAASPLFFDSANAETLAFAERFRTRFGHEPSYIEVQGYESTRLAVSAVRAAAQTTTKDLKARRETARAHLVSLDSPQRAIQGLNGPLWFTSQRGRQQALRFGHFQDGIFESAPIQLTPVSTPTPTELASGAVFEVGSSDRYARLQRIVYTGVFLNEIPRIDLSQSQFTADFYLWLRFVPQTEPVGANPANINFPQLIKGNFDPTKPAEQGKMPDGTEYWLWQVQGDFRNDYDLHLFPFDQQQLSLSFFNSRAPMEEIVYVLDKRSSLNKLNSPSIDNSNNTSAAQPTTDLPSGNMASVASPNAFRNLSQWKPLTVQSRRENLVTNSGLGNPTRIGVASQRELSGFLVGIKVQRRTLATLAKTLLPLVLMTLIMYASLYFPDALVKEKVTVAITAALSGAVLLTSINSQLGSIGYTIAVEYAFYVFFCLSLLCIVSVLGTERLRSIGDTKKAAKISHWTRILFLIAVAGTLVGAAVLYWQR